MNYERTSRLTSEALAEERFQMIADCLPLPVWRLSADRRSLWLSSCWSKYTGLSQPSTFNDWLRPIHPADRTRLITSLRMALSGTDTMTVEFRLRRREGDYHWIRAIGDFVRDRGSLDGIVGVCIDVQHERQSLDMIGGFRTAFAELLLLDPRRSSDS